MHDVLSKEPLGIPTYAGIPPRRIARTGAGVASDFVAGMREMPGLEDSRREQILALRDADGSAETELYRRLAGSRDWGGELAHVVEFMHQRNQDPLTKYASSAESVGRFWFRESAQVVIKGNFHSLVGTKAVGSSGNHSDFVVETLNGAIGDFSFGSKPIQDQRLMGA